MNKSDLIAAMAEKAGVSNKDAGACLDAMFDVVADAVAAGNEKVTVPGWISFEQTVIKLLKEKLDKVEILKPEKLLVFRLQRQLRFLQGLS